MLDSPPPATPGQLSGRSLGEFVVRDKLGEGGFGEVYRAEQPALAREAVVKILRTRHLGSPEVTERFLREARVASRLDHPYAAHIYAFGAEADGVLWIAMELVRGTPLSQVLAETTRIPLLRLVPLLDRLCEVVHTAHEQGIVHRDLKPANVMVIARAGRMLPKLLDLGIAKLTTDAEGARAPFDPSAAVDGTSDTLQAGPAKGSLTRRGDVVGSPRYMAPEQWVASTSVDSRADLYSLGVLAYEALTGAPPFDGETLGALARAHATAEVPALGAEFPAALDAVFRRALAKRPADRYATALELASALRTAAGLGADEETIPRLDEDVRELWLAEAPQPLAEAVAALDGARNAHQARDAAFDVARLAARWLALLALAARSKLATSTLSGSDSGRRTVEALKRRHVADEDWLAIARDLCRPHLRRPDAHPLPELVRFLGRDDDPFAPFLGEDLATSTDDVVGRLGETVPALGRLLRALGFLLDYRLVVPDGGALELWMGVRRTPRRALAAGAHPIDHVALLDAEGHPALSLWPIVQAGPPTPGTPAELFLLDGRGRHGARLLALPRGFERQDPVVWDWFGTELLGEDGEAQAAEPYRGLAAFTRDDAGLFVGRERETEAVLNRLRTTSLLAVVGPSGAGKSSFVQAGVLPQLPDGWRAITLRPGPSPLRGLTAALDAGRVEAGTLVVVVDQLEELFTLCHDPVERRGFAEALVQAARAPEDPVRVIVTLRDDFLIRLGELPPLRERIAYGQGLQLLTTPSEEDLLRILTTPATRAGFAFEDPDLPSRMVASVADRPGALALLSFTAARLWQQRDRHFKLLTRKAYDAMGGVAGALAGHAEDTRAAMTAEEQRLVREAFRHLVTAEGTRAVLTRRELEETLGNGAAGRAVIDRLIEARLLVASDEGRVEIIHEALLAAWPRLVEWRREDAEGARLRDQLRAAARQWEERGRPKGLLWRDDALAELGRWRARFPGALTAVEDAFSATSHADAARGRRTRRLVLGGIIVGLTVALAVTLTLARRASREQARAEAGLVRQYQEQGRQLLLGGDATRAYPYLVEAHRRGGPNPALLFLLGRAGRMLDRQLLTLRHGGPVNDAGYTPDGTRIITVSDDKAARIWDAQSGQLLFKLPHEDKVFAFAISPDGRSVATASYDKTAAIWDLATGARRVSLVGHEHRVYALAWSPDGARLATAGRDLTARIWDVASGRELVKLVGHTGLVFSVAFTAGGAHLLSGGRDGVRIWDAATGRELGRRVTHDDVVFGLAVHGERFATASFDGTAAIFGEAGPVLRLEGHLGKVRTVSFSPDGARLVTTSHDDSARIWDVASGTRVVPLVGHTGWLEAAEFDPSGTRVVTASDDATARVWDVESGRTLAVLAGHTDSVWHARFSPDGSRVVTAGFDGQAKVWQPESGDRVGRVAAHPGAKLIGIAVRGDGTRVATAGSDGHVRVWTVPELRPIDDVPFGEPPVGVGFQPSGALVVVGAERVEIHADGRRETRAMGGGRTTSAVLAPPDLLFAGTADGSVAAWDLGGARVLWSGKVHDGDVRALAWIPGTPDGLISAGHDLRAVGSRHGVAGVVVKHPYEGQIVRVAASPDGRTLLTASEDRTAVLWSVADGHRIQSLEGHTNVVNAAVFSPDGRLVATASLDGSVRLWDPARGDMLAVFPGPSLETLAYTSDYILAAAEDVDLYRWQVTPETRSNDELQKLLACQVPFRLADGLLVPRDQPDCSAWK